MHDHSIIYLPECLYHVCLCLESYPSKVNLTALKHVFLGCYYLKRSRDAAHKPCHSTAPWPWLLTNNQVVIGGYPRTPFSLSKHHLIMGSTSITMQWPIRKILLVLGLQNLRTFRSKRGKIRSKLLCMRMTEKYEESEKMEMKRRKTLSKKTMKAMDQPRINWLFYWVLNVCIAHFLPKYLWINLFIYLYVDVTMSIFMHNVHITNTYP